jgi:predicted DNA-binding protein with PD1-like motif
LAILFSQGGLSRVSLIRILPGADIIESLEEACAHLSIKSGFISSCIGSLKSASFFTVVPLENKMGAGYSTPITLEGPLELLSAQGTIGQDEKANPFIHLHSLVVDQEGRVHGGHFIKGENPALITCEIMISQVDGAGWLRAHDQKVDMDVFSPVP